MLAIELRGKGNVFIITPEGDVIGNDFFTLGKAVDDYIAQHDTAPNVVIQTSSLPHWKNLEALSAHFNLVKDHQNIIKKVAIVTDSLFISMIRPLADFFIAAKIRRFPETSLEQAIAWAETEEDHPGSLEVITGLPDDIVAVEAKGIITAQDYRMTLIPLVETKLKTHKKVKLLFVAGNAFSSYSAGAVWDDARFGFGHFTAFTKIAIVTDEDWIRHGAKLFGPLMPAEFMLFHNAELEDAKIWLSG